MENVYRSVHTTGWVNVKDAIVYCSSYQINLQIWDTPGFPSSSIYTHCKNAHTILIAYDLGRAIAEEVEPWCAHIRDGVPALLMALKADHINNRKEPQDKAIAFAKAHNMSHPLPALVLLLYYSIPSHQNLI